VVYAELGSAYPYAGADYVGVGRILGSWAGVVTLAIWAVSTGPATAFLAKTLAAYVVELVPGASPAAVTFAGLGGAVLLALLAVRTSAIVTGIFLAVEMLAIVVLVGGGFIHPARSFALILHPMTVGAHGAMTSVTLGAMGLAALSAVYATVGGNQALAFGEELIDPHRRMGRVVVVACMLGAATTALPIVAVVLGAPDLPAVLRSATPLAAFIEQIGGPLAGRALSAGVALAMFNALIVQVMFTARLYFSIGRDGLFHGGLDRLLARVHSGSGAPRAATWVVAAFSAACCLLTTHVLLIFMTGLLVYGWGLICLAVLVGRRKGLTGGPGHWRSPLYPLAPLLGLAMAAVFTVADLADPEAGRPSLLLMGVVVAAAAAWSRFVLARRPGGWSPLLPSEVAAPQPAE
jgi:amino acid transporter